VEKNQPLVGIFFGIVREERGGFLRFLTCGSIFRLAIFFISQSFLLDPIFSDMFSVKTFHISILLDRSTFLNIFSLKTFNNKIILDLPRPVLVSFE
jgi:hypothetical protein